LIPSDELQYALLFSGAITQHFQEFNFGHGMKTILIGEGLIASHHFLALRTVRVSKRKMAINAAK
jgi:hypothetical protein